MIISREQWEQFCKVRDSGQYNMITEWELAITETSLSKEEWFFGKSINKLDISILPFIRQFRIADADWFDKQNQITGIQQTLSNFLDSKLFKDIMFKYDVWTENDIPQFFP